MLVYVWTDIPWKKMWDVLMKRALDTEDFQKAVVNLSILPEAESHLMPLRCIPMRTAYALNSTVAGATPNSYSSPFANVPCFVAYLLMVLHQAAGLVQELKSCNSSACV